jgi:hypothetical protein
MVTAVVIAFLAVLSAAVYLRQSPSSVGQPQSAFDVDVPSGQVFANGNASAHFEFDPTVRLGDKTSAGLQQVIFEVGVKNKTQTPIRHLTIGGILDDEVVEALETPIPFFGTATDEDQNLIPGEIPYAIYVSRIAYIIDPERLTSSDKLDLFRALQSPIRLKIKWDSGVEYISVEPVVSR